MVAAGQHRSNMHDEDKPENFVLVGWSCMCFFEFLLARELAQQKEVDVFRAA